MIRLTLKEFLYGPYKPLGESHGILFSSSKLLSQVPQNPYTSTTMLKNAEKNAQPMMYLTIYRVSQKEGNPNLTSYIEKV